MLFRSVSQSRYGTEALLGEKFANIEEKYDLSKAEDGFAEKDEEGEDISLDEEGMSEEEI